MEDKFNPVKIEAEIELVEGTEELKQAVASIVKFPEHKTPDMLFFSGIFVSSGENLNRAYFLTSELVKAHHTVSNKPLDIEHEEDQIVGHIYSSTFVDMAGNVLDVKELASKTDDELSSMDVDIMIAGILYKSRFQELAREVKDGKWKLSMETYYSDYDVKIGDLILSRKEAEAIGLAGDDMLGRLAKLLKKGKEIAKGEVTRVLRDLLFSGCGLVKNPANPRSVILETANKKSSEGEEDMITIEMEPEVSENKETASPSGGYADSPTDDRSQTSVGICVSYKKYLYASEPAGPDTEILQTNWCALYERGCTSPSRGADHPDCLRNTVTKATANYTTSKLEELAHSDKRGDLLSRLKNLL